MKISREELLRQRELVANHLEWIDRQLEDLHGSNTPSTPPAETPPPAKETSSVQLEEPQPPQEEAAVPTEADSILENYGGNPTTSVTQLKVGCILLATFIGALILFFFLGLPYLLTD